MLKGLVSALLEYNNKRKQDEDTVYRLEYEPLRW
jgi:hypothetical protein